MSKAKELRALLAAWEPYKPSTHRDLFAALHEAAPDLLRVVEAARAMITICQYPCGDPSKCGNCNALRVALEKIDL
jgi:hypothetical protein